MIDPPVSLSDLYAEQSAAGEKLCVTLHQSVVAGGAKNKGRGSEDG